MQTKQELGSNNVLYNELTKSVLGDFTAHFGIKPKQTTKKEVAEKKPEIKTENLQKVTEGETAPNKSPISADKLATIQERLDRLEKRIRTLDETKPEYIEERVALEGKKLFLKNNELIDIIGQKELTEKEKQLKEVSDLLNKKSFGYVAPVMSPVKEEEVRIKNAQKAAVLESSPTPVIEKTTIKELNKDISDKKLQEASWIRESFIKHLQITNKGAWYDNPSQNRDKINEYVIKTATLLSGKETSKINMDDIQTSRLFLFKGAEEEALQHPAFSYIESFYNYQNEQGHSGESITTKK